MKLLIHNMLTSNILRGVTRGFPLRIRATRVDCVLVDYDRDFLIRLLPRINYGALRGAITDVSSPCEDHTYLLICSSD